MKAVLQNTILCLLGLASVVVLAAPNYSAKTRVCNESLVSMPAAPVNCTVATYTEPAPPVTHDTVSFLYW